MRPLRVAAVALLGTLIGGLAASPAEGAFILRKAEAREILDPIGVYTLDLFLTGLPGTYIQGGNLSTPGDFVTIFDVPFIFPSISDVSKPPGWFATVQATGLMPASLPVGQRPFDSPTVNNITYQVLGTGNQIPLAPLTERFLGTFVFQTDSVPDPMLLPQLRYAWQTSRLVNGTVVKDVGSGTAPVLIVGAVPEPASLAMTAAGLGTLAALAVRRRRPS